MMRSLPDVPQDLGPDNLILAVLPLMEQLIEVVAAENTQLAKGIPASYSGAVSSKVELAQKVEAWNAIARERGIVFEDADSGLYARLFSRARILAKHMDENGVRLRAAMEATRRRIDAALRSVRDAKEENVSYRPDASLNTRAVQPPGYAGRVV